MKFNVLSEPWVPVITGTRQELISLSDVISKSQEITSIAGDTTERLSILRLLICIVQVALNGPEDEEAWRNCKDKIIPSCEKYFKKWKNRFDLYGEHPFLQVPHLMRVKNRTVGSLNPCLATGNNHTLFDSIARLRQERHFPLDEVVRKMLSILVFAECGNKSKPPKGTTWGGLETKLYGKSSVPNNILLTIIDSDNLLNMIHWNLLCKSWLKDARIPFGKPIWETDVETQEGDTAHEICTSYLYNLVPLSRAMLLEDDGNHLSFADGIEPCGLPGQKKVTFPYRDPMGTIITRVQNKKEEDDYLKVSPEKSPWRDLQSLLQVSQKDQGRKGPWALRHFVNENVEDIGIVTGGFSYNKAKPVMACEWKITIPAGMMRDTSLNLYTSLIKKAEKAAWIIRSALEEYLNLRSLSSKDKEKRGVYKSMLSLALKRYWHGLEECAIRMINELETNHESAQANWMRDVWKQAIDAFDEACGIYLKKDIGKYVKALQTLKKGLFYERSKNNAERSAEVAN